METSILGKTGLNVSRIGFGVASFASGPSRGKDVSEAGKALNLVLDYGINIVDTAASYGDTEELIGDSISHRRNEFILATKFGVHGDVSVRKEKIEESIDRSLVRLKMDYVDILQLHSPEPNQDLLTMDRETIVDTMLRAKEAGKTRFIGYSGDNEAASWAVSTGAFDTLQTSFNLLDQNPRKGLFEEAKSKDMGIIIKRTLAMGMWGKCNGTPTYNNPPHMAYLERTIAMHENGPIGDGTDDPILLAMGFVLHHSQVDSGLISTTNMSHLMSNIEMAQKGAPINSETVDELYRRYDKFGCRQMT